MSLTETIVIGYLFVGLVLGIHGCLILPQVYQQITEQYKKQGLPAPKFHAISYVSTFISNLIGWPYGLGMWFYNKFIK